MDFNNKKIWVATDGSEGMMSQVNGLAKHFNNNFVRIKTKLIFPWSILQPGFLPIYKWIFKNKINLLHKPDILITCGRKSVYLSLYFKKKFLGKIITIHIQNPKIDPSKFDFIIAPKHDDIAGPNIINSVGAIHKFSKEDIKKENLNLSIPNNNLITFLIGGKNRHYFFTKKNIVNLSDRIRNLKNTYADYNFMIIGSRRTGSEMIEILQSRLKKIAYIWDNNQNNPYNYALKYSRFFVITSDSTSMISECASTGKPIYIFHLPFKRNSKRMINFHNDFEKRQITKKFTEEIELKEWKYKTIDEAKRISGILKKRIIERINES